MFPKKPISKADDESLSQLLQLKRQERPDDAFWGKFDEELRSKQLAALVRTQSWYERTGKLVLLVARKSAAATATVSVLAIGVFTLSQTDFYSFETTETQANVPTGENPAELLADLDDAPVFVVDNHSAPQVGLETESIPEFDAVSYYEVNPLTKDALPVSYQIIAEPKQFTAGARVRDAGLGAKVIRSGNDF